MSKPTSEQLLVRVTDHLHIDEQRAGELLSRYNEQITEFKNQSRKIFPLLEKLKEYVEGLGRLRKAHLEGLKKFTGFMANFEETSLGYYSKNVLFADPNK